MGTPWRTLLLGEVITLQRGYDLPVYERKPGIVPVVTSSGISGTHNTAKVFAPGVVIGRYGTIGSVHFLKEDFWPHNTSLYVKDFKGNEPRFVAYLLQTLNYSAHSDKSSVPGVNRNHLHSIKVMLPPLDEQRAIARTLGALDDKIELNRRMNRTLEAMAQAIFKSWFVDFDPVVAKAEGRQPYGMNAETAALFPAEFVDSELGAIPKGWRIDKVSTICTTQYGYTASASNKPIGPRFLRITDINKDPWINWEAVPYCKVTESNKAKYELNIGDVLVSRMADPGKAGIVEQNIDAIFASYLVRLKTINLAWAYLLFYFLRSDQYLDYADGVMSGSVQLGMNAKVIVDANMVLPCEPLVEKFFHQIRPLREKVVNNLRESMTLASIRDTLLPRLLSGEVRVKGIA